jgi:putative oxidoreductase
MILRRLARPLLASVFVAGGLDTLRDPESRVKLAQPALDKFVEQAGDKLPSVVPADPVTLVKLDAAIKVVAGAALALGKFPRLSALLLAVSLLPTTFAGHPFWRYEDPSERAAHRTHFLKNLSLLGGLLLASADTAGKPSLRYRARQAAHEGTLHAQKAALEAQKKAYKASTAVASALPV